MEEISYKFKQKKQNPQLITEIDQNYNHVFEKQINTHQLLRIAKLIIDDSFQSYNSEKVGWDQSQSRKSKEEKVQSYNQVTSHPQ